MNNTLLEKEIENLDISIEAPETEPLRQYYFIKKTRILLEQLKDKYKGKLTACIKTFGCQMNARDSEKLTGILEAVGYEILDSKKENEADFVIYNTCTVRENANLKVYGRLGKMSHNKKHNPKLKIALCGCMMQEPDVVEKIRKDYGFVDLVFGTHNIYKFPELLYNSFKAESTVIDIWKDTDKIVEDLPVERKFPFKSGINIMFGCNNFCSYCIVPYVRGRERSRQVNEIIKEIENLANDGVVEIMLLGQNVNSYGNDFEEKIPFSELLKEVEKVDKIKRIRFMTPHPKDLSDDLIEVIKNSKKICHHIHLPLQSGSSRILKAMNRHYTKEDYLLLVEKIRKEIPDASITTDIIVGFPGETEEDFLETMDVVKKVSFDSAFTFIYSKRTGTRAAKMPDQVPEDIVHDRFDRLLALVREESSKQANKIVGQTLPVLAEEVNNQDSTMLTGKLANNLTVHFKGGKRLIGNVVDVKLVECHDFYYIGEVV
ncbi:tRNA-2-methylthio-N6-dimethylallyladenosine synthase [Acetitomaculum ruminis DSM 5522]|uniref:tRNA-2-methylthio-N(6)-dimethylallyladenosine synthase n=1 Tax=Acetitomaculum ruminis DSM 5522 TaxID=1120918 RepID=A0A1I0VIE6_9FIRM|nr:tRNA (N6-isopentenyl adenosine(37)-C2)-methylthiotransferase MiaB [Acetitomaculum ruminis]SFA76144.1 tRNA-2-methylthio-N6-dimethylallyladenosine synthase [Acetitomaculum ruminis DSM 5522]